MPKKYPDAHEPTAEEVRDVIADGEHRWSRSSKPTEDLYVVGKWDIVEAILGDDPSRQLYRGSGFGPSRESYINPHLSMSALVKVLDQMVEDGVLTKLNEPTYRTHNKTEAQRLTRAVMFHRAKAGWVLTASLDEAYARADARQRDQQRRKLRKAAEQEIITKFAKQVDAAYRRLCNGDGLDPAYEVFEQKTRYNDDEEF